MKRLFFLNFKVGRLLILLLALSLNAFSQADHDTLRLFVIGNSFSQNSTTFLPQMAKERGEKLTIGRAELGGHSLEQHWDYVEKFEKDSTDVKGRPYAGKSLKTLLSNGTWDIVTIQQYSYLSGDSASYNPYAQKLVAYIKKLQPRAQIVIHQTWAYRADAKKFGSVGKGQLAKNQQEMWEKSREAYHRLANQLNAKILPVGDAFEKMATDKKYGYKKDTSFDFEHAVAPNLPDQTNSVNIGYFWNKQELAFDPNHANDAGKYLGGLIWYGILFKESPKKVKFKPESVSGDFAKVIKNIADHLVNDSK
ncbi:DUF4886 domain-containing protein [Pedobacter duraquae]|uniref:Uncharacterized protein DUF4886 n=1 Tax=Pedobacter duraquae TaxID=425511 RepID=A0A4R6ILW7_9SPHI|nr:DUF4886 domain-containing protein [Pedobacter duraquae]TDO23112.1 uncharacterized protein DUF4886 [Pedobacter duraquae]